MSEEEKICEEPNLHFTANLFCYFVQDEMTNCECVFVCEGFFFFLMNITVITWQYEKQIMY